MIEPSSTCMTSSIGFDREEDFQQSYYSSLCVTRDNAYGRGKEWRLAIPGHLHRVGFTLYDKVVADVGCGIGYFGASLIRDHMVKHVDFFDIAPSLKSRISEVFHLTQTKKQYDYLCNDIIEFQPYVDHYDFPLHGCNTSCTT